MNAQLKSTNKYVQGSVWYWKNERKKIPGVQNGERPILIVSNDTFNAYSPVVTCASITTVPKASPVHVSIHVYEDSEIQCEQIHTVSKSELDDYIGMVPHDILKQVKEKLKIQFDLDTDRTYELLTELKKTVSYLEKRMQSLPDIQASLELLLEQAGRGFGLPNVENDFLKLIQGLDREQMRQTTPQSKQSNGKNRVINSKPAGTRRTYTDEEKEFIANPKTSVEEIVARFGCAIQSVRGMRNYCRRQLGIHVRAQA